MDLLTLLTTRYDLYFLLFVRCAGVFGVAPVLGSRYVSVQLRVALAAVIALVLLPVAAVPATGLPQALLPYAAVVVGETLIGLVIGWIAQLLFTAAQLGGELLDIQMGIGMANVLDPQFGIQVPLMGNFQYILATLVFLAINGHHILIQALATSVKLIPIAGAVANQKLAWFAVDAVQTMFVTALRVVAPAVGALLLSNVALGLLSRAMPQMNIFAVGLPLQTALGIAVIAVGLPLYVGVLEGAFAGLDATLTSLLRLLGAG